MHGLFANIIPILRRTISTEEATLRVATKVAEVLRINIAGLQAIQVHLARLFDEPGCGVGLDSGEPPLSPYVIWGVCLVLTFMDPS